MESTRNRLKERRLWAFAIISPWVIITAAHIFLCLLRWFANLFTDLYYVCNSQSVSFYLVLALAVATGASYLWRLPYPRRARIVVICFYVVVAGFSLFIFSTALTLVLLLEGGYGPVQPFCFEYFGSAKTLIS